MRRRTAWIVMMAAAGLATTALAVWWLGLGQALSERNPNEIMRYVMRRLDGHTKLETVFNPFIGIVQTSLERPVEGHILPSLGKGHRFPGGSQAKPPARQIVTVSSAAELTQSIASAQPGTVIELAAGEYAFNRNINLRTDGRADAPIIVRAPVPGSARLAFSQVEGFLIDRPHWHFDGLHIRGVCKAHGDCEHAFHVVGKGTHFRLSNSLIEDFNAHLKINGHNGDWPDFGVVSHVTLRNSGPRQTRNPVTLFDLVGANGWRVEDSVIANFVKDGGNRISYGMFMKGAGEGGHFRRNLVVCSGRNISAPGARVGISFGGGLTGATVCRSDGCKAFEYLRGLAANNIVAHCNDAGIDVNHATQTVLAHNTLVNTAGIVVRGPPSDARAVGNFVEGRAVARAGTTLQDEANALVSAARFFAKPDALDFRVNRTLPTVARWSLITEDFCARPRQSQTPVGAMDGSGTCD